MPLYRAHVATAMDSTLPRHRLVNVLHFNDMGTPLPGETDPQTLANDLAAAWDAWSIDAATREIKVTFYEVGPPPQYPVAEAVVNEGLSGESFAPRELALCLSFYSERNLPRRRGRLYLPWASVSAGGPGLRPSTVAMQKALDLAPILGGIGGLDVDWSVYSRADAQPYGVTHAWVDDEWDIQRSRGLDPTTRLEVAVGET